MLLLLAGALVQHRLSGGGELGGYLFFNPIVLGGALGLALAAALARGDRIRETARIDFLTGALTRNAIEAELSREIDRSSRYAAPFGVMLFDVDYFKTINDTYGHVAGDSVLRELGELVRDTIRKTDLFGRWGGDELMLIAPGTSMPGTRALAEKVRKRVAEHRFEAAPALNVTVSIGLAVFVMGDAPDTLTNRADEALYRAKRAGRNCTATMRCLRPALVASTN